MWLVGLPDYSGTKHAVVGPFPSAEEAKKWVVNNVMGRAHFIVPLTAPTDYRVAS
jgi:hypothetical protein